MNCAEFFNTELSYIYDNNTKETTNAILGMAPEYFLRIPSSTTGKYHPQDEICPGGKALHVKRVVYIVRELCVMDKVHPHNHDIIVAAAIVHDLFFKDLPEKEHSVTEHPQLLRRFTERQLGSLPYYHETVS